MVSISLSKNYTGVVKLMTVAALILAFSRVNAAPAAAAPATTTSTTLPSAATASESSAGNNDTAAEVPVSGLRGQAAEKEITCREYKRNLADAGSKCDNRCRSAISSCINPAGTSGNSTSQMFNAFFPAMQMMAGNSNGINSIQSMNGSNPCELTASEARTEKREVQRQIDDLDKDMDRLGESQIQADEAHQQALEALIQKERDLRDQAEALEKQAREMGYQYDEKTLSNEKEAAERKSNLERQVAQMQAQINANKVLLAAEIRKQTAIMMKTSIETIRNACKNIVTDKYKKEQQNAATAIATVTANLQQALKINANRFSKANQELVDCIKNAQIDANEAMEATKGRAQTLAQTIDNQEEEIARLQKDLANAEAIAQKALAKALEILGKEKSALGQKILRIYQQIAGIPNEINQENARYQAKLKNFAQQQQRIAQNKMMKQYELNGLGARPSGLGKNSVSEAIEANSKVESLKEQFQELCGGGKYTPPKASGSR